MLDVGGELGSRFHAAAEPCARSPRPEPIGGSKSSSRTTTGSSVRKVVVLLERAGKLGQLGEQSSPTPKYTQHLS